MFIVALFIAAKIRMQPKYSLIDEWINCVYIMEYYSSIKNSRIFVCVTTWMDLEGIVLSEISQTAKDQYHIISLTYRI